MRPTRRGRGFYTFSDPVLDYFLVLSRRHPQIESSRDEIAGELDMDTFLAVLCETFQRNSGLARRF